MKIRSDIQFDLHYDLIGPEKVKGKYTDLLMRFPWISTIVHPAPRHTLLPIWAMLFWEAGKRWAGTEAMTNELPANLS